MLSHVTDPISLFVSLDLHSCLDRDNSSASTWTLPTTPKHAKAAEKARKQRRITIITISDSEDEANLPSLPARSRSPSRTPSLVGEGPSEAPDELQEDVSFADYSENEDSDAGATAKKPEGTRRIIEIDSSDSEYDAAAGVITWSECPSPPPIVTL